LYIANIVFLKEPGSDNNAEASGTTVFT